MPDLPSTTEHTQRVANNNKLVNDCLDAMFDRVATMLELSLREEWNALQRQGEFLAQHGEYYGLPDVAQVAQQVCDRLDEPRPDSRDITRKVRQLLSRRPKRSHREP